MGDFVSGWNGGALMVTNGRGCCVKSNASERSLARASVAFNDPLRIPNVSSANAMMLPNSYCTCET